MAKQFSKNLKVLLLYKRSSFLATRSLPSSNCPADRRFRLNHVHHYQSLKKIEEVLKAEKVAYHKHCRSRLVDYRAFDLVITVGGDGTFLEAARKVSKKQYILSVNSDPQWSVGRFCACDASGFSRIFTNFLQGRFSVKRLFRLQLVLPRRKIKAEFLNDILICHPNPAAMSRYNIQIGRVSEEHRNSGIWISTASGSTGAILSAGGRTMPLESRSFQYKPRELYHVAGQRCQLKGGILDLGQKILITSRMPRGNIFVDGAHIKIPFPYGMQAEISSSPNHVNLIDV